MDLKPTLRNMYENNMLTKQPKRRKQPTTKHQTDILKRLMAGEKLYAPLTMHSNYDYSSGIGVYTGKSVGGLGMYRFKHGSKPERAINLDTIISMKHKGLIITVDDLNTERRYVQLNQSPVKA